MSETDQAATLDDAAAASRRSFLKRAAAAGAVGWAAPVILDSLASPASALTCIGQCYKVELPSSDLKTNAKTGVVTYDPCSSSAGSWGGKKPQDCLPSCPAGSTVPVDKKGKETFPSDGKTLASLGLEYSVTESYDQVTLTANKTLAGVDLTSAKRVDTLNNTCSVPSLDDAGANSRLRVFAFTATKFTAPDGVTCNGPRLNAIAAGGNTQNAADNCVIDGGGTFGANQSFGNSFAQIIRSGANAKAVFGLDGSDVNYRANKPASGMYRFTIGCSCT